MVEDSVISNKPIDNVIQHKTYLKSRDNFQKKINKVQHKELVQSSDLTDIDIDYTSMQSNHSSQNVVRFKNQTQISNDSTQLLTLIKSHEIRK